MPQALDRVPGRGLHRLPDAVGDRIETLGDHAGELSLTPGQRLAQHVDAARGVRLDAGKLGDPRLELLGAGSLARRVEAVRARGARDHDRGCNQGSEQDERRRGERQSRPVLAAQSQQNRIHPPLVSDSGAGTNALTSQSRALTSRRMTVRQAPSPPVDS